MKYVIEMASCGMTCIPRFLKIGRGVQVILRFNLSSLRDYSVCITEGRNL
jgi:hypothetical protein